MFKNSRPLIKRSVAAASALLWPVFISAGKGPNLNPDGTIVTEANGVISNANLNDAWVDAKGSFLAAVGAGPVYKLLGKKDVGGTEFPPIDTTLITGDIGFRHTPGDTRTVPPGRLS
jgi:hypothetical protein